MQALLVFSHAVCVAALPPLKVASRRYRSSYPRTHAIPTSASHSKAVAALPPPVDCCRSAAAAAALREPCAQNVWPLRVAIKVQMSPTPCCSVFPNVNVLFYHVMFAVLLSQNMRHRCCRCLFPEHWWVVESTLGVPRSWLCWLPGYRALALALGRSPTTRRWEAL